MQLLGVAGSEPVGAAQLRPYQWSGNPFHLVQQVPGLTLIGAARRYVSSPEPIASQLELREAEATVGGRAEPPLFKCHGLTLGRWSGRKFSLILRGMFCWPQAQGQVCQGETGCQSLWQRGRH